MALDSKDSANKQEVVHRLRQVSIRGGEIDSQELFQSDRELHSLAAMLADEILALDRGRVAARGAPSTVITDRLMAEVYGVDLKVGAIPPGTFVLPQTAGTGRGVGSLS